MLPVDTAGVVSLVETGVSAVNAGVAVVNAMRPEALDEWKRQQFSDPLLKQVRTCSRIFESPQFATYFFVTKRDRLNAVVINLFLRSFKESLEGPNGIFGLSVEDSTTWLGWVGLTSRRPAFSAGSS